MEEWGASGRGRGLRRPFWLKPFWLKLKQMLRWLFFLCVSLHFVMPRRWHQTPNGWWQKSIRGPRPPSVSWPRAQQTRQFGRVQSESTKPADHVPLLREAIIHQKSRQETLWRKFNGWNQPSQFWANRTRTPESSGNLSKLRSPDPESRRWQTGSRRARVSSNGPSAAWFERRRLSREPKIRETCA